MNPLPRSTPEAEGLTSVQIKNFIADIAEMGKAGISQEVHSYMILRHGNVVGEGSFAPYQIETPHVLFSVSKSFTSMAIGIAQAEGLLHVDDLVSRYLSEDFPKEVSPYLAKLTLRHCLTMATGHQTDALDAIRGSTKRWVKAVLKHPFDHEPGTRFIYNTGATYLLSAVIQKITGITLLEYLKPRLFEPLGITEAKWQLSPEGISTGGFGLSVSVESIAKLGQLLLQNGVWEGRQLIDPKWIAEATSKQIENGDDPENDWTQGYGYQFWRCTFDAYRADGAFGQFIVVLPEEDMVVAINSGADDMGLILKKVWKHLLPNQAIEPVLPAVELSYPPQVGMGFDHGLDLDGSTYDLKRPHPLFSQVTFKAVDDRNLELIITKDGCTQPLRMGYGQWITQLIQTGEDIDRLSISGAWTKENELTVLVRYIEMPYVGRMTFTFTKDTLALDHFWNVVFWERKLTHYTGKKI